MSTTLITPARIAEHVAALGEKHPPLQLGPVDRTVLDPRAVAGRFGGVIDFMARVELEVERNVLELLMLIPDASQTDVTFYRDVWGPQEIQHGLILDQLQEDLGLAPAKPELTGINGRIRVLASLCHLPAIQDVARLLYYLTGAATERSAVAAYSLLGTGLLQMGERAIASTIIAPIKRQEPGHFAFYQMSATAMVQAGELAPWQLRLARFLRSRAFDLVGVNHPAQKAEYGAVMLATGIAEDVERHARDIGRVEHNLLWAREKGMEVPTYILKAMRDCLEAYRVQSALAA